MVGRFLNQSIDHTFSPELLHVVEVEISDCLQLFNVMVASKCPKGTFEGGFNVGGGRRCQCQCLYWYWLPNARVHENLMVYFLTGLWNAVRLPSSKTLSLQNFNQLCWPAGTGIFLPLCALVLFFSSHRDGSLCLFAVQEREVLVYLHLGSSWATAVHVGEEWL